MSDYTDAVRGLADDVANLKEALLPVALGPSVAALLASVEQRVASLPNPPEPPPKSARK